MKECSWRRHQRLIRWNQKEIGTMKDAYSRINGIENGIIGSGKFPYRKILRGFITAEPYVHGGDKALTARCMQLQERNETLFSIEELEILANECERLACPFARVFVGGNDLKTVMFAKARLSIFANPGTGKDTKTHPVPNYIGKACVDAQRVLIGSKELLGMNCQHTISEGFLARLRLGPSGTLSNLLVEIRMKRHTLHRHRSRIIVSAGTAGQNGQAVSCRFGIISKSLTHDKSVGQIVAISDCREIGTKKVNHELGIDCGSRLLRKALRFEPGGKKSKARVSRCVVTSTYVPAIGREELRSARTNSSSGGGRQMRQLLRWEHCCITSSHDANRPF